MKWITRERPKIDRLACPWLILRFIDKEAEFFYVPYELVQEKADQIGAIPFDIPGVEFTHYGSECTFDYFVRKYRIEDPAIKRMASIIRGADTDKHELAPQAAGLWAISAGLSYNHTSDHELLEIGLVIYDALYSWASHLYLEAHTQQPFEDRLIDVLNKCMKQSGGSGGRTPAWVKELRELIQDQIDSSLTLKELSRDLDINASYLSREFSRHFDNLSFGEYVRKLRIEKAIELMKDPGNSLTDIAYLTGFSDQSHFYRIFRKITNQTPSAFRKNLLKK
ncbi:chromate resistance protein [Flavihumibacter rivuli]|uniref:chromate resistance protein ChrB domain-containing protein n=1 Tax=Flavihumibacter rivuli TaxID=2838156 RepID=UPI001BDF44E5|nr:chromate resistance protein ChrB domain-containing protein [Flavihumibacter rivuli]ULQ57594.1 chromate resistance protein [Flavihumibacter rivuli]